MQGIVCTNQGAPFPSRVVTHALDRRRAWQICLIRLRFWQHSLTPHCQRWPSGALACSAAAVEAAARRDLSATARTRAGAQRTRPTPSWFLPVCWVACKCNCRVRAGGWVDPACVGRAWGGGVIVGVTGRFNTRSCTAAAGARRGSYATYESSSYLQWVEGVSDFQLLTESVATAD